MASGLPNPLGVLRLPQKEAHEMNDADGSGWSEVYGTGEG